ncbi:MAG: Uma2 family endonuclease [Tenacibaculum sp.]|nr:Uma2 family endonuclease [Tenacibaculum sp.]
MDKITDINQLDLNKIYSYADYLLWKFEERIELLKGKIFKMSPAPNVKHQSISINLLGGLLPLFKNKSCKLFHAPFDVRLATKNEKNEDIFTVVQPDICIICDESKLDDKGCIGAPDLVIEILSPGNSKKEMKNKFELYEEAGVKEYWVVHPLDENILVYTLNNGMYVTSKPIIDDFIPSKLFPNFKIHTNDIFEKNRITS